MSWIFLRRHAWAACSFIFVCSGFAVLLLGVNATSVVADTPPDLCGEVECSEDQFCNEIVCCDDGQNGCSHTSENSDGLEETTYFCCDFDCCGPNCCEEGDECCTHTTTDSEGNESTDHFCCDGECCGENCCDSNEECCLSEDGETANCCGPDEVCCETTGECVDRS